MAQYKFGKLHEEEDGEVDRHEVQTKDTKNVDSEVRNITSTRYKCFRLLTLVFILLATYLIFIGLFQYDLIIFQAIQYGIRCSSPYAESCGFDNPTKLINNQYGVLMYKPEQLHLSLGANGEEIFATWSTKAPTRCYLRYNNVRNHCFTYTADDDDNEDEDESAFTDCYDPLSRDSVRYDLDIQEYKTPKYNISQTLKRTLHTYRSNMTNLTSNDSYLYFVECSDPKDSNMRYRSEIYQFEMKDYDNPDKEFTIAFYGDLGLVNGQSVPRLIKDVDDGKYDIIIHNGDFAYDLNTENGRYGDEFMRMIEPIAARVPYQASVGNHEIAHNFSHYDHRFTMIQSGGNKREGIRNNFFYSFNIGPVHFVGFSTEFYYFIDYIGIEPLIRQYKWLKEDLKFASSPAEREKRPWIVVFGHRPMYCSSRDGDDCSKKTNILRKGLPFIGGYGLEKLFYDFGVDVEMYSHEHQYERFLPIYDTQVINGTDSRRPYYNPKAPVHIISGSAGCQERLDPFKGRATTGSVKQISDYGFTRIYANRTALRFEQISDDQQGSIVDAFVLEKNKQNFP